MLGAVLASAAITLALAPAAMATPDRVAATAPVKSFLDNSAFGIDLADGAGLLRIASKAGAPERVVSAAFDVVNGPYQAGDDARYWEVEVKLHKGSSFKQGNVNVSWHCGGPKPTTTTKPPTSTSTPTKTSIVKPTTPTPTSTSHSVSVPPVTPTSESKPPTSTVVTSPTESAPNGGGDVVDYPVKPIPVAGGTTPSSGSQVKYAPKAGIETGFGGLAQA